MAPQIIYNKRQLFIPEPFIAQTQSIEFDGSSEHMATTVQTSAPRIGLDGTFTIAVWVKPRVQPLISSHSLMDVKPTAGTVNQYSLSLRNTGAGTNSVQWLLGDQNGVSFQQSVAWSGLFTGGVLWRHIVITWGGTAAGRTFFFDGVDQGAPDFTGFNVDGIVDDTNDRSVGISRSDFGLDEVDGKVASVAMWNGVQLGAAEVTAIYNSGSINFNLNQNSGSYGSSGSLVHWWEIGKQASPNLGVDSASPTNPLDVEEAAVNITDADRVADVPT